MLLLSDLIMQASLFPTAIVGALDWSIEDIASDSRQVVRNGLYIAIAGTKQDGARYIDDALGRGAIAVLADRSAALAATWNHAATLIEVDDTRAAVTALAAAFYPRAPKHLFAITGTDGKTSTADFVRQLAGFMGHAAASIGTLGLRSGDAARDAQFPANNTSPEPILLRRTLQLLADAKVDYVALEASSHGLDQKRLDAVKLTAAAFTNLTRDHLDYHGTLEAYAAAKLRLFSQVLPSGATAVLNRDDAQFSTFATACAKRGIAIKSFGYHADADYRILEVKPHAGGLDASIMLDGGTHALSLPLYGAFQLSNMLAAMGLLAASGLAMETLVDYLPKLRGVPGRLEKVGEAHGAPIFVDYAHTPAALENILKTLRPHTAHKLHVVFGCGGDRDAGKRPEMGRAATQFADVVTVTDDNPRSENPEAIRAAIMAAAPGAKNMAGRADAIRAAIKELGDGDVLVVAGKGHETYQIIGNQTFHFSDAEEIQKAARAA